LSAYEMPLICYVNCPERLTRGTTVHIEIEFPFLVVVAFYK